MPATTTLTPIPYPLASDQPFVHLDMKALAEAVDDAVPVISESAPPHKAGRIWTNPATGRTYVSNGVSWGYWLMKGTGQRLTSDDGFPTATVGLTGQTVHNRITVEPLPFARVVNVKATCYLTYSQTEEIDVLLYRGSSTIDHQRRRMTQDVGQSFHLGGDFTLAADAGETLELRFARFGGTGGITPTLSSLSRMTATLAPV